MLLMTIFNSKFSVIVMGNLLKAKYQVYKDVSGKFRFRLRAINNKIVVVSEAYESKAGCMNGVKSVQNNCQSNIEDKTVEGEKLPNPKYKIFVDDRFNFRFNLIASNGQIIASSEGYTSKQGCINGIEAVKRSCGADIEDLTTIQIVEERKETTDEQCFSIENTGIAMLAPPNIVESGTIITFEGWLINAKTGAGIRNAPIDIWESDRSFMNDKVLTSGETDDEGSFNITWKATQQDWWDDTVEVYAKFKGKEKCKPTRSANYRIKVLWYAKRKD
jgi:uncharacterized protein YegP (UPF0339 family)